MVLKIYLCTVYSISMHLVALYTEKIIMSTWCVVYTYHGRRWHMYTGHGPGPHMVGYMTKNDTVSQSSRNVLGHSNTQPRFNLQPQLIDVRICSGRLFHIMPSVDRPVASVEAVGGRGHGIVAAASIVMPI